MSHPIIIGILLLVACTSPLLTWLRLWQMKEWRLDRLLEHIRSEGPTKTLTSTVRVCIGFLWITTTVFLILMDIGMLPRFLPDVSIQTSSMVLAMLLAGTGIAQIALRRQSVPVWTRKAQIEFAVATALNLIILTAVFTYAEVEYLLTEVGEHAATTHPFSWFGWVLVYLQPQISFIAWSILYPLDRFLKRRVMHRARSLRTSHPHLVVIGITGSVGKTTTKELLRHLLKDRGAIATPEHVNTEMGVAQWLIKVLNNQPENSKRILIVEMGAYRKGEIALLCDIAKPTIGVLTFVGKQHVGLFGSEQNIAEAKSELLQALPKNGHAFVNADSRLIDAILRHAHGSSITRAGTDHHAELQASDIEETGRGIRFRAFETSFQVPVAGTHAVTNILLAIAVAKHLSVPIQDIAKRLESFTVFERTFAVSEQHGVTILDNSYNASVESFSAALDWAERQPHANKVLLCDGIIELGDSEERLHRELAQRAATIFHHAFIIHRRFLPYFKPYFNDRVSPALPSSSPVPSGSLLVCIGRMPSELIQEFLPRNDTFGLS